MNSLIKGKQTVSLSQQPQPQGKASSPGWGEALKPNSQDSFESSESELGDGKVLNAEPLLPKNPRIFLIRARTNQ